MRSDFVAFILTHGRSERVYTYSALQKCGYTGRIVLVVDDQDKEVDNYRKKFGDENVYVFDKDEQWRKAETVDNFHRMGVILYARNACFDIARKLGYRYFIELDDDYNDFRHRWIDGSKLRSARISNLDAVWENMIEFLNASNAMTVAMAQAGDFVGGAGGGKATQAVLRKAMNSFICDAERPFQFLGSINEDVNTYALAGMRGRMMFSFTCVSLNQMMTQTNAGGMTETYKDGGTYVKSFYSVIVAPSCVKIAAMGGGAEGCHHYRIHHKFKWDNCAVCIISDKWKKQ